MSIETVPSLAETFQTIRPNSLEHLALLPTNEEATAFNDVVVRYYPAKHHLAISLSPAEAQTRIDDATEHFEVLRSAGIYVPKVYMAHETPDGRFSRIISIAEAAYGTDFTKSDTWQVQGPNLAPHQEEVLNLSLSLTKYYRWILEGQPEPRDFLSDLDDLDQYKIRPDGQVVLIDTDPMMLNADGLVGICRIRQALNTVHGWLDRVQLDESGDKQALREKTQEAVIHLRDYCTRYIAWNWDEGGRVRYVHITNKPELDVRVLM